MPDPGLYAAFIAATAVLMLIPGPNVAMIVGNSVAWGTRFGLLTMAGTTSAMIPQLAFAILGLTAVLGSAGAWFEYLRWAGAAYLIYLGARQFFAASGDPGGPRAQRRSARTIYLRGLLVSLTNPKTLLFYGAFFPQFISPDGPVLPQAALLSVTFLVVAVAIDSGWAIAAGRARGLLAAHGKLHNRIAGGFLMTAGAALALARR